MKKWLGLFLLASFISIAPAADEYEEITYNVLKVSPETYKYKKIGYSAPFLEVITTKQALMEKESLSPKKYLWLTIGDYSVPAIVKKSDTMTELIAGLTRGQVVKVYGKVKQFRAKPYLTRLSHYYVKVDNIEVMDEVDRPPARQTTVPPPKLRRWRR